MSKQQINLFRISSESVKKVALDAKKPEPKNTVDQVEYMIAQTTGLRRLKELTLSNKTASFFSPFRIAVYFSRVRSEFQWLSFFSEHLKADAEENASFFNCEDILHPSFVCFIYSDHNIYAFAGGLGNSFIKDYADDEFGIEVLEKIGTPDKVLIRSARSNNIVGNVAADSKMYRGSQTPNDEDKFGKVYSEVASAIPYSERLKRLKSLIFDGKQEKKANLKSKASLCFGKHLDLADVKTIVEFVDSLPSKHSFQISNIRALKGRRKHEKILIDKLEGRLDERLVSAMQKMLEQPGKEDGGLLEITHRHHEILYSSTRIELNRIKRSNIFEFDSAYGVTANDVLRAAVENDSEYIAAKIEKIKTAAKRDRADLISELARKYTISCFNDELDKSVPCLEERVRSLVASEISYDGKTYFKLSGKWYRPGPNYIDDINNEFRKIHTASKLDCPFSLLWGQSCPEGIKENEDTYLRCLAEKELKNTLVMHRVIPTDPKIELCDAIYWDSENLYLLHVKPSFDGAVRVLEKQIVHGARLVTESVRDGHVRIKTYFSEASGYSGKDAYRKTVANQFNRLKINEAAFLKLFSKKVNFVACVVDPKSKRDLSTPEKFHSSVAKMSVIEAYRNVRQFALPNSQFRLCQMPVHEAYLE